MSRHVWRLSALVVAALALAVALAGPARLNARATLEVAAKGLVNPRGLNFGPDGALYVAEAGSGGPTTAPSIVGSDNLTKYYGATGAVTKIVLGSASSQSQILTALPSMAPVGGGFATGPHDVEFQGLGNGFVTIGLGADPVKRLANSVFAQFGHLIRFKPNGKWTNEEDLAAFETLANPDGNAVDSNPYGLLALPSRQVFTDAGGNSLNAVAANGSISNLAIFPNRTLPAGPTFQAVPTCVAEGPDGSLYVGQLTGGPFPAGQASVYRVPSGGGTPEVFATGFTKIIDIAFGPDGSLYVLQINSNGFPPPGPPAVPGLQAGALIRVSADGATKTTIVGPGQGLANPGGVAVARDGSIYVTNFSIEPGGAGTVVKVNP